MVFTVRVQLAFTRPRNWRRSSSHTHTAPHQRARRYHEDYISLLSVQISYGALICLKRLSLNIKTLLLKLQQDDSNVVAGSRQTTNHCRVGLFALSSHRTS